MNNEDRFVLYDNNSEFEFNKNKSDINIKFNRVAFIFFVFFLISVIYTIHLIHLGSQSSDDLNKDQIKVFNKLKRADIVDINGNFLAKTVSSIDIGINPVEIIDHKKLLLNLSIIFPNKEFGSWANSRFLYSPIENNILLWSIIFIAPPLCCISNSLPITFVFFF